MEPTRNALPEHHPGPGLPVPDANATILANATDIGDSIGDLVRRAPELHVTSGGDSVGLIFRCVTSRACFTSAKGLSFQNWRNQLGHRSLSLLAHVTRMGKRVKTAAHLSCMVIRYALDVVHEWATRRS